MKLPEKIKGRNRIRDAAILIAWGQDHEDTATIADRFGLKERRILQILRANHKAIPLDKDWEKRKRIERLQRWLKNPKNQETKKDPVEIQEYLQKEIDGDKENNRVNNTRVVIIVQEKNEHQSQEGRFSTQVSVEPE